jgi:hypothetical protein
MYTVSELKKKSLCERIGAQAGAWLGRQIAGTNVTVTPQLVAIVTAFHELSLHLWGIGPEESPFHYQVNRMSYGVALISGAMEFYLKRFSA